MLLMLVLSTALHVMLENFRIKIQCHTVIIAIQENMLHLQDLQNVQTVTQAHILQLQLCDALSATRVSTQKIHSLQSALIVRQARVFHQRLLQCALLVVSTHTK